MATLQEQQTQVVEVYIATFNRAPDADGLAYWVSNMTTALWTIGTVAQSMFDSPEVAEKYPPTLSDEQFIDAVYSNVFNRTADADGKIYWLEELSRGIQRNEMLIAVVNGAKADTGSATDKEILSNKTEVGENFAVTLGLNDLETAKTTMELVTIDPETVLEAKDTQQAFKDSVPFLKGTEVNDHIEGTSLGEYIYTYGGDDKIIAGDGDNKVVSGSGIDTLHLGIGNDTVRTNAGNDTVYAKAGDDTIDGGAGSDSLHGEDGNDYIVGGDGNDYLYGEAGNDTIYGNDGDDFIYGDDGDDFLYGGADDDIIYVDSGTNLIDAGDGNDTVYGGLGNDTIYGGAGNDTMYGDDGVDIIDGLTGNDIIYAGKGNDIINGNEGTDILYGSEGDDVIDGEDGIDYIVGGLGSDILSGGEGVDTFVFSKMHSNLTTLDNIKDFTYTTDKIHLVNQGTELISSTKVDVSAATSLQAAADIAAAGDGSTNALVNWFSYEDSTYIVEDLTAGATFVNATDIIIKLQGIQDLSGLSSTTITFL